MANILMQYPWEFLRPLAESAAGLGFYINILVFLLAAAMFIIAVLALRKTGSSRLKFVALAFFFFALKWGIKILDRNFGMSPGDFLSDASENVFELTILALLFFAIFRK